MMRFFFVVAMLCLTLAGCGEVEWFPDSNLTPGVNDDVVVSPFSFTPRTNVTEGLQTSDPATITITGNGAAAISVSGAGSYRINGGFTTGNGSVRNGDQVVVQHNHPASAVQVVTTVTIADKSATFTTSTASSTDNVPAFTIAAKSNSVVGAEVTSDAITVALGGTTPVAISVANGSYSIGSAAFTTATGIVNNGDQVRVRHTAGAGRTVTTLTIGDRSATFVSNTTSVSAFTFNTLTDVPINTTQTSNVVTLTITGGSAPITVSSNDSSMYSINGRAFTADPGTVKNGEQVRVRHISGNTAGRAVSTTLTVGDKRADFITVTSN